MKGRIVDNMLNYKGKSPLRWCRLEEATLRHLFDYSDIFIQRFRRVFNAFLSVFFFLLCTGANK